MQTKECIAMLLAGGQGSRLRVLTKNVAKPAVPFGGQYRIIDFSLSNCRNSGIDTVGVLTQYKPLFLNSYIGIGSTWDLNYQQGGTTILPPFVGEDGGEWYKGTAHAVYQNLDFIEQFQPENVLILSGDHIYKMDYSQLLNYHKEKNADITIAVIEVPWEEAGRFGVMALSEQGEIVEFQEKPEIPESNLASMGVYVFRTDVLKSYLTMDAKDSASQNDFGKNVIPRMLAEGKKMFAYPFCGYWKDVGTIESYWMASMDILDDKANFNIFDSAWCIYSANPPQPPHYIGAAVRVKEALISEGCSIHGEVDHSVIFPGVTIGKGSQVKGSVIMSNVKIEANVKIENAIIGENTVIGDGSLIGGGSKITMVEDNQKFAPNTRLGVLLTIKRAEKTLSEVAGV